MDKKFTMQALSDYITANRGNTRQCLNGGVVRVYSTNDLPKCTIFADSDQRKPLCRFCIRDKTIEICLPKQNDENELRAEHSYVWSISDDIKELLNMDTILAKKIYEIVVEIVSLG